MPIGEATAEVITGQQQRVRAMFPDTAVAELTLLPSNRRNPHGHKPIRIDTLDAGVPIDLLAELLDHRSYSVTRRYYRIGEDRRRAAVDTVTALSFDRHRNRIWREAHMLLESERARHAVGEVSVPYGTCTEPTNVKAGGGACPVRFRCVGCDHLHQHRVPAKPAGIPR
ncbi:MAG: hypothetical protein ACSLE6_13100 [Mycobacterium sp.]